ncbi:hypothetical protein DE146DRAFT_631434 [Phaeosphaeria sp. MPI-PUGE-AT-0046c]|nr:hypothetical protein DE146DRAFT_631434 [Phaeosphaeria sp. MPI-PUGE-AT-0046c]
MQPFKPHFLSRNDAQIPTEQAAQPVHEQAKSDTFSCTLNRVALYRAANKTSTRWAGDALIRVSPRGNATLEDAETGELLGSRSMLEISCLRPGTLLSVGRWRVQIQGDDMTTSTTAETASASAADLFGKPYTRPTRAIATATYGDICLQCKQTDLDDACDGQTPCGSCLKTDVAFCCYLDTTCAIMLRHPAAPGANYGNDSLPMCENCRIFGRQCDGAGNGPCKSCIDNSRAFCTIVNQDGTVISVLCAAYRVVDYVNGTRSVAPRTVFKPDLDQVWPPWPKLRPNADTLDRLCDRFATQNPCYNLTPEELMQWYRSGPSNLPKRRGR